MYHINSSQNHQQIMAQDYLIIFCYIRIKHFIFIENTKYKNLVLSVN